MINILGNQSWYTSMSTFLTDMYEVTNNKKYLEYAEFVLYHYIELGRNYMVTGGLIEMIEEDQELLRRDSAGIGIFLISMLKVYKANGDPEIFRWINYALEKLNSC